MNKNKVILSGKVGQDARIINLPDGAQVVRFILATSEVVKGRNGNISVETQWHNVVAWNNNGIEDLQRLSLRRFFLSNEPRVLFAPLVFMLFHPLC